MSEILVGAKGNMGRRYFAILRHLGVRAYQVDLGDPIPDFSDVNGVIIATPTDSHYSDIKKYASLGVPILCEKAITKNPDELKEILDMDLKLAMVNQYEFMFPKATKHQKKLPPLSPFRSHYDYWNSGKDGIEWDCINIIGMSKDKPALYNRNPIWNCLINGRRLNIADMDKAYIAMIEKWLDKRYENKEYIEKTHKKVWDKGYMC